MGRGLAIVLLTVGVAVGVAVAEPVTRKPVRAVDLDRIRELYRLTDTFGDDLWPGFDAREVPICLNLDDERELLIAHPTPPEMFEVLPGQRFGDTPILIREGCAHIGPGSGGWATDVYGLYAVYMSAMRPPNHTENYLSVFLHECFHVYQRKVREYPEGRRVEPPRTDPSYCALIGLESRILHAAVEAADDDEARDLVKMFLAVRCTRRAGLSDDVVRTEADDEYNEGTAKYIQVRLVQLLGERGGLEKKYDIPRYEGFQSATTDQERFIQEILPKVGTPITFFHAMYNIGMAQCLLLDRFRPDWKVEMRAKGSSQTALLERQFPLGQEELADLVAIAKKRFDHAALEGAQAKIIDTELSAIRKLLEGPGRRYRIYTAAIRGPQKRKVRGRAYRVPPSMTTARSRTVIWTRGMWLEKGDLTLTTKNVPIIVQPGYVEWIDREPAADGSDFHVEYDRLERGVYKGLRVTTDGFVLEVGSAIIRESGDVVSIRATRRRGG